MPLFGLVGSPELKAHRHHVYENKHTHTQVAVCVCVCVFSRSGCACDFSSLQKHSWCGSIEQQRGEGGGGQMRITASKKSHFVFVCALVQCARLLHRKQQKKNKKEIAWIFQNVRPDVCLNCSPVHRCHHCIRLIIIKKGTQGTWLSYSRTAITRCSVLRDKPLVQKPDTEDR